MAYFIYYDDELIIPAKDSSVAIETIFQAVDTELGITYRVVFYPETGFMAAGVHYSGLGYLSQFEYVWEIE